MIPALIGAAVFGGIAYALIGDDKNNEQWYMTTERHTIPESELPPAIRRKLKNSSRQSNEELLRAEGFKPISASEVPADILAKVKRKRH